jgi:DNA-binding LacI/PurR family transcriptional regulator
MAYLGRAAVTIDHVALAAGVSRSTASRVLSGGGSASTSAGIRVRSAAAKLGYVPNPLARALARGVGTRVVLAVSSVSADLHDPYLGQVMSGAAEVCEPEGVGVSLQWLPLDAAEGPLARLAADRSVRGVVLINTTENVLAAVPNALRGRVASIGIGSPSIPSFDVDNGGAASALVSHLHVTGRRQIAMITGPDWLPCSRRPVEAYRSVMRAAGLPARIVRGDFSAASGQDGALEVLNRWPDTDAIFAICDATALGVLSALRGLGVTVPGDVAVAGFDDIPFAALSAPALTTATHPVRRIAAAAAAAVLDQMAASPIEYPSRLVLRESA